MKLSRKAKYKLILCLILCVGVLFGILFGIRDYVQRRDIETISMKDALADYDYMWEVLEGNYPFLKMAERKYGLSMDALKTKYRGDIEALGNGRVDFCEYYELLQECIGKFRGLAHLNLYTPYTYHDRVTQLGDYEQTSTIENLSQWISQPFNDPVVKKRYQYLMEKYDVKSKMQNIPKKQNLTFRDINDSTAYVKIQSFNGRHIPEDHGKLADWFTENAGKKYVIIDITGNGGGNDSYWMNSIVAPNIDETLEYTSYYLTPYGEESRAQFALDHTGFEDLNPNLDDLLKFPKINPEDLSDVSYYAAISPSVTPATGEKLCGGQFFLLVDQGVYSAADAFAMFCKTTGFATVVGVNTKGDGGGRNVYHLKLPQSGLILRYRAMHGLNPDGSSNVEFGTTPDVAYSGVRGSSEVSFLGLCLDYIKSMEN